MGVFKDRSRSLKILRDYNEVSEKIRISIRDSVIRSNFTRKLIHERKRSKGVRRMPWLRQAKKDAVSCEKGRGLANTN